MERAYIEEKEHLKKVLNFINEKIEETETKFNVQKNFKIGYSEGKKGTHFNRQAFMTMYATELTRLKYIIENPYFARIDFKENNHSNANKIYIGKKSLVDDRQNILTYDWRSEIASMYYDYSLGKAEYNSGNEVIKGQITKKRQINIENGNIKSIEEQDTITDDKILLKYLNNSADSRLKTIVATIQKEQNNIIRKPLKNNYIIQGVAGSGKTTVALHRIAYLLYNEAKNINESDFMILGPNKYFLNYISSLLPELDISFVNQSTFEQIALNNIGKLKLETQNETLQNVLLGNIDENIIEYKSSLEFLEMIKSFMEFYINSHIEKPIIYEGIEICSSEDIKSLIGVNVNLRNKYNYGEKINIAKKHIIKTIKEKAPDLSYEVWEKYREEYLNLPPESPRREEILDITNKIDKELKTGCKNIVNEYFKFANVSPSNIYTAFINNLKDTGRVNVGELKSYTLEKLKKKKIGNEDLAPLLLIKNMLKEIDDYKKYGHIVIDEGQDLSLSQYYILKMLFSNSNFDIYGDLNQSIYAYQGIKDWNDLNNNIFENKCATLELNKGYRTTEQICDISNSVLETLNKKTSESVARTGEDIIINNSKNFNELEILNVIRSLLEKKYKTIAIICKDNKETEILYKKLKKIDLNINKISDTDVTYDGGICIMPSYLSKGLEFDAVIINDASESKYNSNSVIDMKLLYVAITRGLHELYINHKKELTKPLNNMLSKEKSKIKMLKNKV